MATAIVKINSYVSWTFTYSVDNNSDPMYSRFVVTSAAFNDTRSSGLPRRYYANVSANGSLYVAAGTSLATGAKTKTVSLAASVLHIRSHAAGSMPVTFRVKMDSEDGKYSFDKSTSVVWTVPALPSYTVSYAANGGSSTPSSQTQWYNEPLKLANAISRSGYTFYEWKATNGDGYLAGGTYMKNAATTMTAQWKRTLTYNANGGTGAPGSQTSLSTTAITITSTKPTRTGYRFLGWSTTSTGTVQYSPGGTYAANNPSITLYAVWGAMITSIRAQRCNPQGNLDDEGTCMLLEVGWNKSPNASSAAPTLSLSSTPSVTMPTPTLSGTNGVYTAVVQQWFDSDTKYTIKAVLADNITSHTATALLDTAFFTMDVLAGGHGVCFGGPAKQEVFEVDMPAAFKGAVSMTNPLPVASGGTGCADHGSVTSSMGDMKSTSSASFVQLHSVSLAAGKYMVSIGCYAANNTSGVRQFIFTSATSVIGPSFVTTGGASMVRSPSPSGWALYDTMTAYVAPTTTTTYRVFGYQNSGSSLNMRAYVWAVKIG